MPALLDDVLAVLATGVVLVLSAIASVHALLHKREVHASISWAALIWLVPVVGAAAYWLLGRS
jgi:cardiolipin synthase